MFKASKLKINNVYTDEYGIHPQGRYEVPTAEQDVEYVEIKGRNGSLTKKRGFKDIQLPITFNMTGETSSFKKVFRKAKNHLFNAKTIVVDDDDEVFYKVKSVQIETATNDAVMFGEFTVLFTLDPFQHDLNKNVITITEEVTIKNEGYEALPVIKVWCEGTGRLYVNNIEIVIQNVNGTITLDSEMKNAYREGNPPQNMNKKMVGEFPALRNGNNPISFNGDITKLELTPNFRWL